MLVAALLVSTTLATLSLLLAATLLTTTLLAAFTLLTTFALAILALLTLLATLSLLLALLTALALLLALLLTLLALALLLTVLALLPLLTHLGELLLQAFDLRARALNGRHLTFHLILLSGPCLLAVAQLVQRASQRSFLLQPPCDIRRLSTTSVIRTVLQAFTSLRLLRLAQPIANLASSIRVLLTELLRLTLKVALQLLVFLQHLVLFSSQLLTLLRGETVLGRTLLHLVLSLALALRQLLRATLQLIQTRIHALALHLVALIDAFL